MTDWDAAYRAGETPWDKGAPSPGLVAELADRPLTGAVLVPGCGRGNDLVALCDAGAARVVGLDLSPTAVEDARARLADHPQVEIVCADLFDLPDAFHGAFDAVFEHTCFCAIPRDRRDDYVRAVADALRPGGVLLALFYLTPRDDPDPALGPPFNTSRAEIEARFGPRFETLDSGPPRAAFPERSGREELWRLRRR